MPQPIAQGGLPPADALGQSIPSSDLCSDPPCASQSLDPFMTPRRGSLSLSGCHWAESPLPHLSPPAALASPARDLQRERGPKGAEQLNQTGALTAAGMPFSQIFVYPNLACPSNSCHHHWEAFYDYLQRKEAFLLLTSFSREGSG